MKINYVKTTTYLGVGATTTFLTHVGTDVITNTYGSSINSLSEGVGASILIVVGLLVLGYIVVKAGNGVDFLVKKIEKFTSK
jgi:hypothetical protein